jgi:hypothetical protein
MADNAFLDKGVILGFCFFTDPHHRECRRYLFSGETEYFATEQVENIFRNAKDSIIEEHRSRVLRNIQQVKANYQGELSGVISRKFSRKLTGVKIRHGGI